MECVILETLLAKPSILLRLARGEVAMLVVKQDMQETGPAPHG